MATVVELRNAIAEYCDKYRKVGLPELEESQIYSLDKTKVIEGLNAGLFWPDTWPHNNRKGIYAIFSQQQLLYIGKASLQGLGCRLSRYFRYGEDGGAETQPNDTWTNPPTHVITWAVPEDMPFEASAIEGYLISVLGEELVDNTIGIGKGKIMSVAYSGEVEVEDNDFTMEFERFIIRENEIAIAGSGDDEDGEFEFEGTGQKNELGQYNISIKLVYPDYRSEGKLWEGRGMIVIQSVEETPKRQKCSVKGEWRQDGDSWEFMATLENFKER